MKKLLPFITVGFAVAAISPALAIADTQSNSSITITGSPVTITSAPNFAFGTNAILTGAQEATATGDVALGVRDLSASGSGWTVQLTASALTNASSQTLPVTDFLVSFDVTGGTKANTNATLTGSANASVYQIGGIIFQGSADNAATTSVNEDAYGDNTTGTPTALLQFTGNAAEAGDYTGSLIYTFVSAVG
ncbi:MAG: WxL domain-containing protein [Lactobacillales bacterium]|jgi:hypothetical protein|nr:WxL domain-containing protein [Lactobacillales bacterium]